ncbi:MAG: SGNH/GDSL hydrolase family protein, partial [Nodosilinea sp.]
MTIALLGDSLLDTGNLTNVLAPFGILPFPDLLFSDPPYSGGKASNDLVLGEAVVAQLGVDPDSLLLGFRLPTSASTLNPLSENINYAAAGATTGLFGSVGNSLETVPIGVQTQAALFIQDVTSASISASEARKPDIILSAGSNDVFEVLADIS